nr:aldo-keto reductase family 1 member C23-like protein isoform X1 [Equus caballus]
MDPKGWRLKLNDGHSIPVLGFGTYAPEEVPKSKASEATKLAIDAGFRHIDCAHLYNNEKEVGQAIRSKIEDGTVKREDIFYTSKLWVTFLQPQLVQPALERSLKNLQLDYVDLYIIHSPVALKRKEFNNLKSSASKTQGNKHRNTQHAFLIMNPVSLGAVRNTKVHTAVPGEELLPKDEHGKLMFDTVDLCATWEAMEKCKYAGLTKSIGVSNFNRRQLEMILNKPGLKYKPVCNQVECHPYLTQRKLLDFCKSKDIVLVAYSALGTQRLKQWVDQSSPVLLEDPALCAMAKKYQRTPAQIALRYQLQRGVVVLAKSYNEKRIKENVQVFEFQLTSEDVKVLDDLNRNLRYFSAQIVAISRLRVYPDVYIGFRHQHMVTPM